MDNQKLTIPMLTGMALNCLATDQEQWSRQTFGDKSRGPLGSLRHMAKEVIEAQNAIGTDNFDEEMADILILWLDACWRNRTSYVDVIAAAIVKMEKNRQRKWPAPSGDDMPTEHIREEA